MDRHVYRVNDLGLNRRRETAANCARQGQRAASQLTSYSRAAIDHAGLSDTTPEAW
jgi:hypothetical protein